jgi:hypothetical protein
MAGMLCVLSHREEFKYKTWTRGLSWPGSNYVQ